MSKYSTDVSIFGSFHFYILLSVAQERQKCGSVYMFVGVSHQLANSRLQAGRRRNTSTCGNDGSDAPRNSQ